MLVTFSKEIYSIPFLGSYLEDNIVLYSKSLDISQIKGIIGWGLKETAKKAREFAKKHELHYFALEDGFVCSYGLRVNGYPPLSLFVDPVGIYYNAYAPSLLEDILNNYDFAEDELKDGEKALELILEKKISKYNYAPPASKEILNGKKEKRVLVIDQTKNDASVVYGCADEKTFRKMFFKAKEENRDADIYVKIHPDVILGKKKGYLLDLAVKDKEVFLIMEDVNSLSLLEFFDKVYTVSSQMGFEALLLGKEVHCFGMPFYAGWGLTKDLLSHPRRKRRRTLLELFTASYLKYPRYINPETGKKGTIFDVIGFILKQRKMAKTLGIKTYYFFGMHPIKRKQLLPYFKTPFNEIKHIKIIDELSEEKNNIAIVVWGAKQRKDIVSKVKDVEVITVEDGFIRSIGLGAEFVPPMSIIMDKTGIYYDPTQESDLERILNTYQFSQEELEIAERIKDLIVTNRITKYNVEVFKPIKKPCYEKKIILIPGQVETDHAVILGKGIKTNYELVKRVREKNPDAHIIYKPHPDVISKNKQKEKHFNEIAKMCDKIETSAGILSLIEIADEVHTISSLSGFEALIREKVVYTYGGAFYAGWGLTVDELTFPRRKRLLSLTELIAGVLLLYPVYYDWRLKGFVDCETIIQRIIEEREKNAKFSQTKLPYPFKKLKNWFIALKWWVKG
jgi:capsular polysaccharide export protein